MERKFLFVFDFEKGTRNEYVGQFLKNNRADYFFDYEDIYADIFGANEYYKLEVVNVCNSTFEVYYYPTITKENNLSRLHPLVQKCIRVEAPVYSVRITFESGKSMQTVIRGCMDKLLDLYLNNRFDLGDGSTPQVITKVEFLKHVV